MKENMDAAEFSNVSKETFGVYPWETTGKEAIDWGFGDSMDVDMPGPNCAWQGETMEGKVARDDEDVVLGGAPECGGGEEGVPSAGEDGRDGCLSAERSMTGM